MTGAHRDAPNARLFVALWPPRTLRTALAAAADRWAWNDGAARVDAAQLHLTLHFLGAVPRERIAELRNMLALPQTECLPFTLTLSRPALWPGGIAVFEPMRPSPALMQLQAALGTALRAAGFATEPRPWRPHLTLARHAAGTVPPAHCAVPPWRVRGWALIESSPPGRYAVVQRYEASEPAALERSQSAAGPGALQ